MTISHTLNAQADQVSADLAAQDEAWGCSGWTRRRFIGGVGMVGAAALASQLVTSRVSFATTPTASTTNTVIVVFLRGAADGLRILSPHSSALGLTYLNQVRPNLVPTAPIDLNQGGWALNATLQPLYNTLWNTGELAFVPGVSAPGISRSHFQAQQWVEKGGTDTATSGWLDRALGTLGAGTTFRAVAVGGPTPLSMLGPVQTLAMPTLAGFTFPGWSGIQSQSIDAVTALYRGMSGSLAEDVPTMINALGTAAVAQATAKNGVQNGASYPSGSFSQALKDLANMLRAEVGVQVATIDVGGWDTHTDEANDLDNHLTSFGQSLAAFMTDLGTVRRRRVTVVVQTEFGRRVAMNASGGTDHGHGSLMWLLGGGLKSSGVFGSWTPLSAGVLDQGDVPGVNNPFDVLGELLTRRLGAGSLSGVFPAHIVAPIGVTASS